LDKASFIHSLGKISGGELYETFGLGHRQRSISKHDSP
jgi:hypothetical protein